MSAYLHRIGLKGLRGGTGSGPSPSIPQPLRERETHFRERSQRLEDQCPKGQPLGVKLGVDGHGWGLRSSPVSRPSSSHTERPSGLPAFGSTICATPTPPYSSGRTFTRRWSRSGWGTRPSPSRSTRTATWCPLSSAGRPTSPGRCCLGSTWVARVLIGSRERERALDQNAQVGGPFRAARPEGLEPPTF
jgi:hypothetical protein